MSVSGIKKLRLSAIFILAGALVIAAGYFGFGIYSQKTVVELYVFDTCGGCNVQNPCKPCVLFTELINKYKRVLAENNLGDKTEFKAYNVYFDNDAEVYRKNMTAIGLEEVPFLPAIAAGGALVSGDREIVENIAAAVRAERRFVPLLRRFFGFGGEKDKIKMGIYDEKTIVNFSLPFCEDCKKTDALLENTPGITVVKIDPSDAAGRTLYERYCKTYGVPINDYAAPRLFVQKSSFLGYAEAETSLEKTLNGKFKTIKIELAENG